MTPRELAAEIRELQRIATKFPPDSRYRAEFNSVMWRNYDTILAALESVPESEPIKAWAIKHPGEYLVSLNLDDTCANSAWTRYMGLKTRFPTTEEIEQREAKGYRAVEVEIREIEK